MTSCIEAACEQDARFFGSLCKRHFYRQMRADSAFAAAAAAEPVSDIRARAHFWQSHDQERAAFRKALQTGRMLHLLDTMSAALGGFLIERADNSAELVHEDELICATYTGMIDALRALGHTLQHTSFPATPDVDHAAGIRSFQELNPYLSMERANCYAAKITGRLLQDCARTKLRNDPLSPTERTAWIAIHRAAYALRSKAKILSTIWVVYMDRKLAEYDQTVARAREVAALLEAEEVPAVAPVGVAAVAGHPLGGIHLGAFGADDQNVHTAPAQQSTARALELIRPRVSGQSGSRLLRAVLAAHGTALTARPDHPALRQFEEEELWWEFVDDIRYLVTFDIPYRDVLDVVMEFAAAQPSDDARTEVLIRLAEEVVDGRGMCAQGKMTRLVNVLRGLDPALDEVPTLTSNEQLQARMAVLATLPLAERDAAATAAFAELGISIADQGVWREALLEA